MHAHSRYLDLAFNSCRLTTITVFLHHTPPCPTLCPRIAYIAAIGTELAARWPREYVLISAVRRRFVCDQGKPACARCTAAERECSYDWTLGPHIFAPFGNGADLGAQLEQIRNPHDTRRGSYGRVYRVRWHDTTVAVKVLHDYKWTPARGLQLCLREAWTWAQLSHPNIAPFLGLANYSHLAGGGDQQLCMVSPWASAGNAEEYVRASDPSWSGILAILSDIASGVEYLHQFKPAPIIHGDLKANNVLIFGSPVSSGRFTARLVDFGLSRSWCEGDSMADTTTTTGAAGNARWLAWERIQPSMYGISHAALAFTTQSDVFEMMRTFLQLLTKEIPYGSATDLAVLSKVMNAENPPRPVEGALASNNGMWNLMLRCWSIRCETRLHAPDIKAVILYYRLCAALQRASLWNDDEAMFPLAESTPALARLLAILKEGSCEWSIRQFDNNSRLDLVCTDDVYIHGRPLSLPPDTLRLLLPMLPPSRWRTFLVRTELSFRMETALDCCKEPANFLTALRLILDPGRAGASTFGSAFTWLPRIPTKLFAGATPQLKDLCMHYVPLSWAPSTLRLLESLDVRHHHGDLRLTLDHWTSLLRGTPGLRRLTVIASGPRVGPYDFVEDLSSAFVELYSLRILRIGSVSPGTLWHLLDALYAPNVHELCLHGLGPVGFRPCLRHLPQYRYPDIRVLRLIRIGWDKPTFLDALSQLTSHAGLNLAAHTLLPALQTLHAEGYTRTDLARFHEQRTRLGHTAPTSYFTDKCGRPIEIAEP
ncbi:kinase-like protein [Calocera viscosa TUFC12733]|uniref:Kinase-like protein n=1 Tax=Calocera viscosa (strain TUFC12733) TaxID=1330018 RepID=A0A167IC58_CALVF|nr:kinase-like protein [Calocera viscosa TUFC12733]